MTTHSYLKFGVPFVGVDTVVLDGNQTKPILINRDPEPYETNVPVDSCVSLDIINPDFDGIALSSVRVWIDEILAFDGSSYDGENVVSAFIVGFRGEESTFVHTDDELRIKIDPEKDFVSKNRTTVKVHADTGDAEHPGELRTSYSFDIEDETAPVLVSAQAWGQKLVRLYFGEPLVQQNLDVESVVGYFPWGVESLSWDQVLKRYVLDDISYPYVVSGTGPFSVKHLDTLNVIVDGEQQNLRFLAGWFAGDSATAEEVSTMLKSEFEGVDAWAWNGKIVLRSLNQGGSIQVVGGTSNVKFGFPADAKTKCLKYNTLPGEYAVAIFTTYQDGRIGERRAFYDFAATDERFVLEPKNEPLASDSAVNHRNYTIQRDETALQESGFTIACATVAPVSARLVASNIVELELDVPMTPEAPYLAIAAVFDDEGNKVHNIVDENGNAITDAGDTVAFTGWQPPVPSGRRFELYRMLPQMNRDADTTKDLYRMISVLQETMNLVLYDIDRFPVTWDAHNAAEYFVDALLFDLGNPFGWLELDLNKKRQLLLNLVRIYDLKGTAPGVQAVLRFFLSIDSEIHAFNDDANYWIMNEGRLGIDTRLGMSNRRALYTFDVEILSINGVLRTLTDEEESNVRKLIKYMKPAHTHLGKIIQPAAPETTVGWVLGLSRLGQDTTLHEGD